MERYCFMLHYNNHVQNKSTHLKESRLNNYLAKFQRLRRKPQDAMRKYGRRAQFSINSFEEKTIYNGF